MAETFFPSGTLGAESDHRFYSRWFAKFLEALEELALSSTGTGVRWACRFLWLRSFNQPISVRVQHAAGAASVIVKRTTGKGGYEPGTLDVNFCYPLSEEDRQLIRERLAQPSVWEPPDDVVDLDGAAWVLELYDEGDHRVLRHQSPEQANYAPFREACLALLSLAGPAVIDGHTY